MERDDIIRMAREAGIEVHTRKGQIRIGSAVITGGDSTFEVVRFAALVAAHEREACERLAWNTPEPDDEYVSHREAIANAIRARGEA